MKSWISHRRRRRGGAAVGPDHPRLPAHPHRPHRTALNQRTIRVSWTDTATGISGYTISNGCGIDGCNGGALNVRTGPVTAATVTTTPGAYQCFYVQALSSAGASQASSPGCISTPEMNIPSSQEWTDTGITARAGAAVGISAIGEVYLAAARSTYAPGGDSSCTPAANYAARSTLFPAPQLHRRTALTLTRRKRPPRWPTKTKRPQQGHTPPLAAREPMASGDPDGARKPWNSTMP
jgi:hypothetical protein